MIIKEREEVRGKRASICPSTWRLEDNEKNRKAWGYHALGFFVT
jgi:hypothetical protein